MLCITTNSIEHQSFVYTKLNDQTVLFLTIEFSISHLFALWTLVEWVLPFCRDAVGLLYSPSWQGYKTSEWLEFFFFFFFFDNASPLTCLVTFGCENVTSCSVLGKNSLVPPILLGLQPLWIQFFFRPVAIQRLKSLVCPIIYP